jgi:hypothetical protein
MNTLELIHDRTEVEQLVFLYARGNDRDSTYFDKCLAEDVEVLYEFGTWRGRERHKAIRDATIGKVFSFTQHVISNSIIHIDGDTAHGEYYVFATHGLKTANGGQAVVYAGATYYQDCVRTPDGWRVTRHRCTTDWIDDAGGLMEAVAGSFTAYISAAG